jgi:Helix-turn-helix domain
VLPQHHGKGGGIDPGQPGTAAEIFGLTLRQLRTQAGLSLRALGKSALYDYTRLSRAEHGEILIPEHQVQVLDDVLHAGGLLVTLRRGASAAIPGVVAGHCSVAGSGTVILEIRLPGGGSITMNLSRRQFAQLLATSALSSALPGTRSTDDAARAARALDDPARLDGEVLGYFRRALDEYYRADKMLGPRRLIGPVLAQIDVLDDLRRDARPPYADPLPPLLACQGGERGGPAVGAAGRGGHEDRHGVGVGQGFDVAPLLQVLPGREHVGGLGHLRRGEQGGAVARAAAGHDQHRAGRGDACRWPIV